MKTIILIICLFLPIIASAADEYDNKYCKDPAESQKWANLLNNNPESDAIAAIHALWLGLCIKVQGKTLTTSRANSIFEEFKSSLIRVTEEQKEEPSGSEI